MPHVWTPLAPRRPLIPFRRPGRRDFRELLESLGGIVWEASVEPRAFTFVSARIRDILGVGPEAWLGPFEGWEAMIHPEDRAWAKGFCEAETAALRDHAFEYRMVARDGRIVWLRDMVTVVQEDGRAVALRGVMVDVSDRRLKEEAQAALKASEQRLRDLLENQGEGFATVDAEERFTFANPAAEAIFGTAPGGLVGRCLESFLDPRDLKIIQRETDRRRRGEKSVYELELHRPDGSRRWLLVTATPQLSEDGSYRGASGIFRDITEGRLAQRALTEAHGTLLALVVASPLAIFDLTSAGQVRSIWNPAAERIFGQPLAEVLGQPPPLLEDPDGLFRGYLQRVLAGESFADLEVIRPRPDGTLLDLNLALAPLRDTEGRVTGAMAVAADISERRRAEEALRLSQHLVDHTGEAILAVDPGGRLTFANEAALRSLGHSREDLLLRHVWDIDAWVTPERWPALYRRIREENGFTFEGLFTPRQGPAFPVEIATSLVSYRGQEWAYAFIRDIRERKAAEAALLESEAKYRAIVDNSPDAIMRFDAQGRHLFVSAGVEESTGIPPDAFIGKTHAEMGFPENLCRFWEEKLQDVFRTGRPVVTEFDLEGPTGASTIDWRLYPEWDEAGEVRTVLTMGRDITARTRAEHFLRESERRFRTLTEQAPFGIALLSPTRVFEYVNPRFTELLGQTVEGLHDRERWMAQAFPDPEDRAQMASLWDEAFGEDRPAGLVRERTLRICGPDGQDRHCILRTMKMEDGRYLLTFEDITERLRALEALQESEGRFRSLFESMREGFAIHEILLDSQGAPTDYRYLDVNPAFEELTGIPREQWVGRTVREVLPGTDPYWIAVYGEVALTGVPRHFEQFNAPLGRHFETLAFSPRKGLFAVLAIDVTARKEAQDRLLAVSQDRMALLEAASVAKVVPWSMDLESGALKVGDSAFSVLGQPASTFHSHPAALRELLRPEDRKRLLKAQAEARSGAVTAFEAPLRRGEGASIWTRWTLARRGHHLQGVIQDVTESHELQAQLLQSQKLESLGTLVSGITHDFNNILMGILGYAEVLQLGGSLTEGQRRGLEVIHRAADRGRGLVNQLLKFSRKRPPSRERGSLNSIIEEVRGLMALPGDNRITVEMALDPNLPPVLLDAGQISQVLMNLAVNARDAIPGRGSITFRTGVAPPEAPGLPRPDSRVTGYVFGEVEDTGTGMTREVQARIFEPFFTTKGTGRGTGLGLSVVHGILRSHGGFIQVDSQVGRGTRFRILLPLGMDEDASGENRIEGVHQALSVLVLDDAGPSRDALVDMLTFSGFRPSVSLGRAEILEAHRREPFWLVIANLASEDGRGLAYLQELQNDLGDLPTVVGAAKPQGLLPVKGLRFQPRAVVRVPWQPMELLESLQRVAP